MFGEVREIFGTNKKKWKLCRIADDPGFRINASERNYPLGDRILDTSS